MAQIVNAAIGSIDANPCRLLKRYPYNEKKLDALKRSMQHDGIGCWEGIIARKVGDRYQIAFGHHRVKAAKDIGLDEIPLIVRKLDDKQMVQFMGRENLDDYAADFQVLLETWEAAEKYSQAVAGERPQVIDIARLLGWTMRPSAQHGGVDTMTDIARACNAAHKLIAGGHIDRDTLRDMRVSAAKEIVERTWARIEALERTARERNIPRRETERAQAHVAKAAKVTATHVREGRVAQRDIRSKVDSEAFMIARHAKKVSPLFDTFGRAVSEGIAKMLATDATADKLQAIKDSLGKIELDTDRQIVERIKFELVGLSERAQQHHKDLSRKPAPVTKLRALTGGNAA